MVSFLKKISGFNIFSEKKQYHELVKRYYASPQYQSYMQVWTNQIKLLLSILFKAKQRWDSAEVRDDDEMTFSMEPIDDVATDDNSCSNRAVHAMRWACFLAFFHHLKISSQYVLHAWTSVRPQCQQSHENYASRSNSSAWLSSNSKKNHHLHPFTFQ